MQLLTWVPNFNQYMSSSIPHKIMGKSTCKYRDKVKPY